MESPSGKRVRERLVAEMRAVASDTPKTSTAEHKPSCWFLIHYHDCIIYLKILFETTKGPYRKRQVLKPVMAFVLHFWAEPVLGETGSSAARFSL